MPTSKTESYHTRCRRYEAEKRKLVGLSPKEYEEAVKRLAEKSKI